MISPHNSHPVAQPNIDLDFIFQRPIFWRPTYITQSAWLEHIPFAFWLMTTLRPRKIVELGTHYGSSYFSFCQAVSKLDLETQCYAVDTWGGDEHAGLYGEEVYRQVSEHNQQHYSSFSTLIRSTFDQALERFPQGSIDLLHIDGLHTLEAVRHDFDSWLPKLSDKAVVIMHDTNVRERGFGVFQLLDELKQRYPHFEFVHGHGLGVIGVGSEQPPEMLSLYGISENAHATKQVHEVFSRLGKACGDSWENGELKRQMAAQQSDLQAENQQTMEQHALERGRLAERITAQHHSLSALQSELEKLNGQAVELDAQQQRSNSLASELALCQQQVVEGKTALVICEQQRDQSLESQHALKNVLEDTQKQLTQTAAECDLIAQEKQALFEQKTEMDEHQNVQQQLLHDQALSLNEETQRSAQLALALSKSNLALTEQSRQLGVLQQQIDEQDIALSVARQQQNEMTKALANKTQEATHWQEQQQALAETHNQLQIQCDILTTNLEAGRVELEQYESTNQSLANALDARAVEVNNLNQKLAESVQKSEQQGDELEQVRGQLLILQQQLQAEKVEHQQEREHLLTSQQQLQAEKVEHQKVRDQLATLQQKYRADHSEHGKQLSQLNQTLDERFNELAMLTRWLEEREQSLADAENEKQKQQEEHYAYQQLWKAEQAEMVKNQTNLQQQLTVSLQQVAQLNAYVSEMDKHSEELEANVAERFHELAVMTRYTEQLTRELQQKEQQLQKAKDRAQNLKQTVSWKLTAPVRALARPFKESPKNTSIKAVSSAERIAMSGLFDELWYQHRYPEVADSGLSAIEHFMQVGSDKGYSPSELFDTRWYLQTYADVAEGTINPLLHYILHGKAEQRHCLPDNMRK
ncbi:class I SAM-dependent methyltransferase [Silvania hatchlandensis]|uniref:Class I SAM-dependent methyltransferase n=1 Tax=Silvania hatchlandensis TaxID=2926469 RepID=A0A9J6PZ71_9ENTR|nr:class I SAM-dependent methyltransferase [Silvania hatchlandensis]MCU6665591.1 class I SAM-dependent methyltransferase [Silvania hatchlandensis]